MKYMVNYIIDYKVDYIIDYILNLMMKYTMKNIVKYMVEYIEKYRGDMYTTRKTTYWTIWLITSLIIKSTTRSIIWWCV